MQTNSRSAEHPDLARFFLSWVWVLLGFFVLVDMLTWNSSLPNALILGLLHLFGKNTDVTVKDNTVLLQSCFKHQ